MNATLAIRELTKDELIEGVGRARRKAVLSLLEDRDVSYVVLMESADMKRKSLLTVGPALEYPNLSALSGVDIDGLQATAYVDASSLRGSRVPFRSRNSGSSEQMERLILKLRTENRNLQAEVARASKSVELVEQERILLRSKADRLKYQKKEQSELQVQLSLRESDLLRMEEELMDRMNQLVVKEAELEQWEENLFSRERVLAEEMKKGKPGNTLSTGRC